MIFLRNASPRQFSLCMLNGQALYAYTVLLFVYRIRQSGSRVDRLSLPVGLRGEFLLEAGPHEYWGKRPIYARLLEPGTTKELIPHLENARVVRVRRAMLVAGTEVIARATKSKGERYRQTWVCSPAPISQSEWPPPPRNASAPGFDAADDDAIDPADARYYLDP